jgi:putative nucleotidyltransferase-like protein
MNPGIFPTLDAEGELLLRCCAASGPLADRATIRECASRVVDWDRFVELADRNGVIAMVGARLGAEGIAELPPHVARALRFSYQVNALRSNHLAGCAAEVVDSFAAHAVPAIAIKGPALAIAAYGDVAMREFVDLDFMVRLSDLPRAAKALEQVGFSSTYRAEVVESGFFPDTTLDFVREDSAVDLHWSLSPRYFPFAPEAAQIWDRTSTIELLGRRVRTLGPADAILFQACHGSKHGWTTLAQVCDFAHLLATAGNVNWTILLDDARRARSRRMLLLAVDLAHSLELCEAPAELLDAASRDSHVVSLTRQIAPRLFDLRRALKLDDWATAMRTIESTRDRATYIAQRTLAPKMSDCALMPLPRALYPLYYLARPLLVAIKHHDRLLGRFSRRHSRPPALQYSSDARLRR